MLECREPLGKVPFVLIAWHQVQQPSPVGVSPLREAGLLRCPARPPCQSRRLAEPYT